ncbi:MAG: CocE/NonD family hydrolase [Chloroflexota bacterium]|nr:CocE/NonD family hydrolase [Chloroflexota bacterium]
MRIRADLPRQSTRIETWIPMSDGARLSATVWLPVDAEASPVPAIFECEPYRKNDFNGMRDARQRYLAGHGYAFVQMDLRGSGDSDGIMYDEYLPQEQEDAVEAIAWIAAQAWCTGKVGMWGVSWSGFNSLQVAARRPPALAAIITMCSTDDRYADDVHYMGGCMLANEVLGWASTMLSYGARPPLPDVVGDRWREMWLDRLERTPPYAEAWVGHQRRDAYWKQGSVCEDYSAIDVPVYAIGGWADGYTNAVQRLVENLPGVRKGLIGPWPHGYPHVARVGPQIGFLQEALRWWDRWLKGVENGIENEPVLRVWMQEAIPPSATQTDRPGRWLVEPSWPSPNVGPVTYALNTSGALDRQPGPESRVQQAGPLVTALDGGIWCPYGAPADFPGDQRATDGMSLAFTSAPLAERVEILGYPEVSLALDADRAAAQVAVRLCDVAPDGASTLISYGLLNLTHRESHEHPAPLEPGRRYEVLVRLNAIAYAVPAGHRLRVGVSQSYWPLVWPSPELVTLGVYTGASALRLPVRAPIAGEAEPSPFDEPETVEQAQPERVRTGGGSTSVRRDLDTGHVELRWQRNMGVVRLASRGLDLGAKDLDLFSITEGDPLSVVLRSERTATLARGDWRIRVETVSTMTGDAEAFHLANAVEAYEGEARVFTKSWTRRIPRDHL